MRLRPYLFYDDHLLQYHKGISIKETDHNSKVSEALKISLSELDLRFGVKSIQDLHDRFGAMPCEDF